MQIRGSIPVFWAEVNNLRYIPDMQIMERPDTIPALQAHLKEQTAIYGPTSMVNLINTRGHEQQVREAYERDIRAAGIPNINYHHFDFHKECSRMRWDRIHLLTDALDSETEAIGSVNVSQCRIYD